MNTHVALKRVEPPDSIFGATMSSLQAENEKLTSLPAVTFEELGLPFHPIPAAASPYDIVKLTLVRSGHLSIGANYFLRNQSTEKLYIPDHTFLIEKTLPDGSVYRLVWDLGLRPNFTNPTYVWLNKLFEGQCRANVPQLLEEQGVDPKTINAAAVSHLHFDHLGDISAFPSSTQLILGPKAPTDIKEQADLLDVPVSDLQARSVRVLSKETDEWVKVGAFEALDYFKDGSVHILSSPGHTHHHISCLVRVSMDKYFLLGSDTCHHCAFVHASKPLQFGTFTWETEPEKLVVMMEDPPEAYKSVAKTRRMEQEPNIAVWIAHDLSIDSIIEPGKDVVPIDPSWFDKIKARKVNLLGHS